MSTTSILAFGDLHYSFEPPASRKPSYRKELDDMLDEIRGLAKRLGVSAIVSAGDHFHRKGRTSHAEVRSLLAKYRGLGERVGFYSIAGNHDMIGHNAESATETQPLGVLAGAGVVRLLDKTTCLGASQDVGMCGIPYRHDLTPALAASSVVKRTTLDYALVVMHAEVLSHPVAVAYTNAISDSLGVPIALLNGHIHEPIRTIPVGDSVYVGLGSIARTSIAERGVSPSVAVVTFGAKSGIKVKDIPLTSALPFVDAFDVDEASGEPVNADLDKFVELVGGDNETEIADVRTEARELGVSLSIPESGIEEAVRLLDGRYDPA